MDNNEIERKKKIDKSRILNHTLKLKTTTLNNLLEKYNAPRIIDYFSLDIEGAETRVFREFPFDKYTFLSMTIERPSKELNDLLFNNGYVFIKNNIYDTFYIHKSIDNFNKITKGNFSQVVPKEF